MKYRAPHEQSQALLSLTVRPRAQGKRQKTPSSSSWSEIVDVWRADANKRVAELVKPQEMPRTKVVKR